ncbi:hypothetical protein HG537_0H03310 [Torulaspora globosa]|uniref:SP-RING-type domain-containing protein n=1 Tax=Torulaspora globosa TaxID=48254 RepID=A0A7H9HXV6_9SACH|nr:hypothetical protein HG537_0H03310 [Torulaspora sp. CBS 2947]
MGKLPSGLPVHRNARSAFHELNVADVSRCCRDVAQQLVETYRDAMGDPGDELDVQMNELIATYRELVALESSSRCLETKLENAKGKYRESSHNSEPVELSSWNRYISDSDGRPGLLDIFNSEETSVGTRPKPTGDFKLLEAIAYLWKDPTAMMPDENNDDDVHIEGGKIELCCPITCQDFERPMISKKCNHVFDLQGLQNYFQDYTTRVCPMPGCSLTLSINDFEEDEVMKLRCQIEKVKKKNSTEDQTAMHVI